MSDYDKETIKKMISASAFLSNDQGVNDHVAGGFKWCLGEIERLRTIIDSHAICPDCGDDIYTLKRECSCRQKDEGLEET
jgi:hypothetical protein